jgi:CBS domain-containing protein
VRLGDVKKLPQVEWPESTVAQVMTPVEELSSLPPNAGAERALEELAERDVDQLPVVERQHVIGLVGRGDLMKWLALKTGSKFPPPPALARR